VDYATGSSLECAACLDIARIKELLSLTQCYEEKRLLCEVTKMLVGLRKAWADSVMREEPPALPANTLTPSPRPLFHHESLEVYQAALGFMAWFVSQPGAKEMSARLFRQIDEAGTSIVLNIAEGNGRYAELDHQHFLQIAQSAAVKAAVCLDLCVRRGLWAGAQTDSGKERLRRISTMAGGF
jgi:four helix bundle protein